MANKQIKLVVGITAEGSVNLLLGQLAHFKSLGYKTYLLAPYSKRSAKFCQDEGCEHLIIDIERDISLWKDLKTLWQIIRIFRRVKPDIVNLGTSKVSLLGMIAASLTRVNYRIYTSRGFRPMHEKGIKRKAMLGTLYLTTRLSHKIICISKSVQQIGIEYNMFTSEKSIVINKGSSNGIDLEKFDINKIDLTQKVELKTKLGLLEDNFIFGYVGRLVDRKGINELYAAFEKLYDYNNKITLVFVGSPEHFQIKDPTLIPRIKKHPGVFFLGSIPFDLVPLYISIMDVFVLPAWWEGFGNVLIQAAAMGVPVISTKALGTVDAVNDGYNGMLVEPHSVKSLIEAMKMLLEDPELRAMYGNNGVLWAKNFHNTIIWSGMEKIYEQQ